MQVWQIQMQEKKELRREFKWVFFSQHFNFTKAVQETQTRSYLQYLQLFVLCYLTLRFTIWAKEFDCLLSHAYELDLSLKFSAFFTCICV